MVNPSLLAEGEVIRHVEEDELGDIFDLLEAAFPHVSRDIFRSIILDDPAYDPRFSLTVERDGTFLSFLQIYDRTIWIDGKSVRIGGIGSLATPPQHRRRGYASALLARAIQVMAEAGMSASILFAAAPAFYERHGWRVLPRKFQEIPLPPSASDVGLEQIAAGRDIELIPYLGETGLSAQSLRSVKSIYDRTNPGQTGKILRSQEYWQCHTNWCRDLGYLVRSKGSSRCYFRYRLIQGSCLLITEYGLVSPHDAECLVRIMLATAKDCGAESVTGSFCTSPPLRQYLENSTLPLHEHTNTFLMWNDLGAKKKYLPDLERAANDNNVCFWTTDSF